VSREQRAAIGEAIVRLERQFYGRGPSSVRVSVTEETPVSIVALSVDSLTAADRTLSELVDIVQEPVTAYLAQIHALTGYGIRVFLFDEGDQTEIESGL